MQEHNDQRLALVGTDYALITVHRYESRRRYLTELICPCYWKGNLPLAKVNNELVRTFTFYFYLKTGKGPAEYRYPLYEVSEENYKSGPRQ